MVEDSISISNMIMNIDIKIIYAVAFFFGFILFFGIIYLATDDSAGTDGQPTGPEGPTGPSGPTGPEGSRPVKSNPYKSSKSLDKLYDEAGGNDPLSDAFMTTQIDISTEDHSCAFMMTHKGVRERQIECKSGCSMEADDDNSNFCKQFIYRDPVYNIGSDGTDIGSLSDSLLDMTYIQRRKASKK
jgi:hypothetical protein